jgi:hypothetical protein
VTDDSRAICAATFTLAMSAYLLTTFARRWKRGEVRGRQLTGMLVMLAPTLGLLVVGLLTVVLPPGPFLDRLLWTGFGTAVLGILVGLIIMWCDMYSLLRRGPPDRPPADEEG